MTLPFVDENGVQRNLRLERVVYVPDIAKNLLSVPTMTKNKAMVMFDNEKCIISKDNNSVVIGSVCGYGKNLYRVNVDREVYMK